MKKKILLTLLLVILAVVTTAPAPAPAAAPAKPIVLRLGTQTTPTHFTSVAYKQWAQKLEERTEGRVKVEIYVAGVLGPPTQYWEMLKGGALDISWIMPFYYVGTFPLLEFFDLPYVIPYQKATPSFLNALFNKFLYKEWSEVKVLWPNWMMPIALHMAKKPVRTIEDLKGKQIRCPPGIYMLTMKALGATPIEVPTAEVYTAVERGMVEGLLSGTETVFGRKYNEVTKYHVLTYSNIGACVTAMNLKKWNSLPPDIQKIIDELSPMGADLMYDRGWKDENDVIAKLEADPNRTVIRLSPEELSRWMETTKSVVNDWVAEKDAKGLPVKAMLEEVRRLVAGK